MSEQLFEPVFRCVFELAHVCQTASGEVVNSSDSMDMEVLVSRFGRVPSPRSYMEALVAAGIVCRFTDRVGQELHRQVHRETPMSGCAFEPERYRVDICVDPERPDTWNAESIVRGWAESYQARLSAAHPLPVSIRAKQFLRASVGKPVSVAAVAREMGCSVAALRRQFSQSGESISQCRTHVRLAVAIERLRRTDGKVEAIALEVGWKSKKDLYKALARVAGVTPATLRRLPEERVEAVHAKLVHQDRDSRRRGR